jgi:hypothetical protein
MEFSELPHGYFVAIDGCNKTPLLVKDTHGCVRRANGYDIDCDSCIKVHQKGVELQPVSIK